MKILIATLYQPHSILTICNKFAIESVIALIDEKPDKTMSESIRIIEESLGKILSFKTHVTDLYDIVSVAREVVSIIDEIPEKDEIYVDVTSGRKPKSFGLVYGAYTRAKRIKQITYVQEENNQPILLPKMFYPINETQLRMLHIIKENKDIKTAEISKQMSFSRGLVYRYLKELLEINVITKDADQVRLTDYGEIVLL